MKATTKVFIYVFLSVISVGLSGFFGTKVGEAIVEALNA